MRRSLPLALAALLFASSAAAQPGALPDPGAAYPVTSGAARLAAAEARYDLGATSLVKNVPWRNVGPSVMSGRIVDVDVIADRPAHVLRGLRDRQPLADDRRRHQRSSRSSRTSPSTSSATSPSTGRAAGASGSAPARSTRRARRTQASGCTSPTTAGSRGSTAASTGTHHIARVLLDPSSPDIALVAALGPLYIAGGERGVFKTTDAGQTWTNDLPLSGNTGAIDLARDPPTRYASTRRRGSDAAARGTSPEAGAGSGLYKSSDGGDTWARARRHRLPERRHRRAHRPRTCRRPATSSTPSSTTRPHAPRSRRSPATPRRASR